MRFDDGAADPKPHAGAVSLGGKEGINNLAPLLRRQADAGISDRDQQLTAFRSLRLDGELASVTDGNIERRALDRELLRPKPQLVRSAEQQTLLVDHPMLGHPDESSSKVSVALL